MLSILTRKNRIDLTNYNYRRDIEHRLFLARLNALEIDVLKEVLGSSLKFSFAQLAHSLEMDEKILLPALEKFAQVKLLHISERTITVDKELRKYYEMQIIKFESHFKPGMEFLQKLLSKIPIDYLLNWYAIPRTSNHIFQSIIEKYLLNPKIYERYLQEVIFDEPLLEMIFKEISKAPDFKVSLKELMQKYSLSHEDLEKIVLLFEFHLLGCLVYEKINDRWEEFVTFFHEWREYQLFLRENTPKPIKEVYLIQRQGANDFSFIQNLVTLLNALRSGPLILDLKNNLLTLSSTTINDLLLDIPPLSLQISPTVYASRLIDRLLCLKLAYVEEERLYLTEHARPWLKLPIQEQALSLYKLPLPRNFKAKFTDRDCREVEKSLSKVAQMTWIFFEDFLKGLTTHIGCSEPVILKNRGMHWKYAIPIYQEEDYAFIEMFLFEKLFEAGMIALGCFQGKKCFQATAFGCASLF